MVKILPVLIFQAHTCVPCTSEFRFFHSARSCINDAQSTSLIFELIKAETTTTIKTSSTIAGTTKTGTTTTTATTTTKTSAPGTTSKPATTASTKTESSASTTTTVATSKTEPAPPSSVETNAPAVSINTDGPDIGEDATRMPLEDAQKIFLPIIIIFTVIAIALAIGYFISSGKSAVAKKWMIIFIGMCFYQSRYRDSF